jgi:hypothetical protein
MALACPCLSVGFCRAVELGLSREENLENEIWMGVHEAAPVDRPSPAASTYKLALATNTCK